MQTIEVTIEGITPLIVNRFHEEAQAEASSGIHSRRERPTPEQDAEDRLYLNGNGNGHKEPYFPAENIRQAIIAAAGRTKIGRRSATTDVAAAIYITPYALPLSGEWHVDTRPVVIPATGGRILRHRPMFDAWTITFTLTVDTDLVDIPTIRKIVEDAGKYAGIGDFRPPRKGPYGKWQIIKWESNGKNGK